LGLDISRENKYMAAIIEMSISRGQEIGFPAPIWKGLNITIVDDSDIRLGLYSIITISLRVEICTTLIKAIYIISLANMKLLTPPLTSKTKQALVADPEIFIDGGKKIKYIYLLSLVFT
jgi:hypothetical protein